MTERKKAPKPCKVSQRFIAKLNESTKLLESEKRIGTSFGKNLLIIGSEIWYVFDFP